MLRRFEENRLPYFFFFVNFLSIYMLMQTKSSSMDEEVCSWRDVWLERMVDTSMFYK